MKISNVKNAVEVFETAAIEHTKSSQEGDYKLANKNFFKLTKAAKYLKDKNQLSELEVLLDHEEKGVEIWAATYLLSTRECIAKQKLQSILEGDLPHHSFTAKMTLNEWEKGNLELQFN